MKRLEFSKKTKRLAWERADGRCEMAWGGERCNAKLFSGNTEYDHILECARGGANDLGNCVVSCAPCHRLKTKKNRPAVDKTRRQSDMAKGIRTRERKGRPLPGTRASGIRKRMDGTVEKWT